MSFRYKTGFKQAFVLLSLATFLASCSMGYDKYMEDGRKFKAQNEYEKAAESFHN